MCTLYINGSDHSSQLMISRTKKCSGFLAFFLLKQIYNFIYLET
jgi:hypothetical protein